MSGNSRDSHKDKEFGQKLFNAFAEGLLRYRRVCVRLTKSPKTLLTSMLLCRPCLLLVASRQARIRAVSRPSNGFFIHVFDSFGPRSQILIVGIGFFEIVDSA